MVSRILADFIILMHLAWIVFMLVGFVLTVRGFFMKQFFDRWLFRSLHLCGILYVGFLAMLGRSCPLTILENSLRMKQDPTSAYPGLFIVHYVEKLVYPDVNPFVILLPTVVIAVFTVAAFVLRPPRKFRNPLSKMGGSKNQAS